MTAAYDTTDAPLVDVVAIEGNRRFGHIALGEPEGAALASFVDLGPELHFWAMVGVRLDPTAARNLASELVRWADRKETP